MNDINSIRPTSLNHLIGNRNVVETVRVALDASFQDGKPFDTTLLLGPPGIGKSQTAFTISQECASEFHEILGQSLKTRADLNALLLGAAEKDVVHIDEAHELSPTLQTSLYLALDKRVVFVEGNRRGGKPVAIPLQAFTLLLSSTDEFSLLQPLRDRCRLILRFQFLADEELVVLLRQRIRGLGWHVEDEVLPLIAKRSRGTPRWSLRLLQAAHRVARSEGESTITVAHLERACLLENIDAIGLGVDEQRYLQILAEGAVKQNQLASILGLPVRTVSTVIEPYLQRAKLITKDEASRRHLTALGREHLGLGSQIPG